MMKYKVKIKVIKKNAIRIDKTSKVTKEKHKKEETRGIVSTVSDWVNEFRSREETKQTFDQLFAQN